jgi:hypothetical protein
MRVVGAPPVFLVDVDAAVDPSLLEPGMVIRVPRGARLQFIPPRILIPRPEEVW